MTNNKIDAVVSVIIPAYNAANFIGAALQSVLGQSWPYLDIIVVNDGSTDNTVAVVNSFLTDKRIRLLNQDNAGCSSAKNTGLLAAKGDFIQYLDADDILSSDKIEEQVKALTDEPWHIAVCRTKVFSDAVTEATEQEADENFLFTSDNTLEFLLNLYGINGRGTMIQPNAFLISRQLASSIGAWDISISPSNDEDGEYFCRALLKATKIWFTPNGINYYRKQIRHSSLSKQMSHAHAKGFLLSLKIKLQHLLAVENSARVKQLMSKRFADYIYSYALIYPDLYAEAEAQIKSLGIKKIPTAGGRYFKSLARIIGFKNALNIKKHALNLLKHA